MKVDSPAEFAGLKRALGRQLAVSRQAAEIGQQQLAHQTGYSRSSVAHAEAGRQLLTRAFWKTADELVKADGALLAGYEQIQTLKRDQERRSRDAELAGVFAVTGGFRPDDSASFPLRESLPSPDVAVARSQDVWRGVRSYLRRHGIDLAKHAVLLYDPAWQVSHTPTLALPGWLPSHPVPIESVTLEWIPEPPRPVVTGQEAELRAVLPLSAPRHAFPQYTSAIRYLDPPSLFENRPSYRLLDVSWERSGQGTLQFGLATFFDKLDVSEALSHEFAAAKAEGSSSGLPQLPFRALLSRPFDLSTRMATTSIDTFTIRRNTTDGSCTFLLLGRDPAKVVVGGNEYGVIPAGEFQPASISRPAHSPISTYGEMWFASTARSCSANSSMTAVVGDR